MTPQFKIVHIISDEYIIIFTCELLLPSDNELLFKEAFWLGQQDIGTITQERWNTDPSCLLVTFRAEDQELIYKLKDRYGIGLTNDELEWELPDVERLLEEEWQEYQRQLLLPIAG